MAVHAHPDDESSKGAATMAKYVAEGVDVLVVTATGGERGSVLNPKMDRPDVWANIGDIRRAEMDAAAAPLVRLMRQFRPHVVTTYDEEGGYPHPDHIMTHKVTVAAFDAAGDPERHPELGEPWQPLKLYYDVGFSRAKIMSLHEAVLEAGLESPYGEWMKRWDERPDKGARITTRVECADYFPVRDDALRAHATQIDPDGFWFQVPMELQKRAWPTEDFQLARSLVDSPLPESDLFAGVREACRAH